MSTQKPLILITNDDGISAKGIRSLLEAIQDFGELVLIVPDSPQSGMGHAITIHNPLRLKKSELYGEVESYSCSGTPVDCVKLGVSEVMHRKPDLLISGINHGANTATNVLYSGTMSAAVEGAMEGIPSIGFSLDNFDADADFSVAQQVAQQVVREVLTKTLPIGTCLNVNVPNVTAKEHKGIKICKQAHAYWEDSFAKREDQFGKPYYWLTGNFTDVGKTEDTDLFWIEKGFSTIVPTKFDMTAYEALDELKNWNL
mgnify:CR=1 FL=1